MKNLAIWRNSTHLKRLTPIPKTWINQGFQGNIAIPQAGHKDNNGYYFLTQLHQDDVIQAIKDYSGDVDEESIENHLTDQVMRKVAEEIVDSLLNDLYWVSIVHSLDSELPEMMES